MAPDHRPASTQDLSAVAEAPVVAAALVRSVADGLYVVDRHGRLLLMNPAGHRLLGYDDGELDGRDLHAAIHFQDAAGRPVGHDECALLGVLRSGGATRVESDVFTRRDGTAIEVGYTSSAIVEDGEVTGAVVIFRDVTDSREVERRADRLSAEREEAGIEWQRNLLPARLAEVPGVDIAVSFRPVGTHALVGGDFYDVIPAGEGHLLVLGDVRGKGPGAAAIAAMVRFLLRGAADHDGDARRLLRLVNAELMEHPSSRFCTLALVHLLPAEGGRLRAVVSCAGHPQPVLLTAAGATRLVGGTGPLLGVFDSYEVGSEEVVLEPGDSLVLFSDGLTDIGRRLDRPHADVAALLTGAAGHTSAETVSHLEQAAGVVDVPDLPDDVAVLVARLRPVVAAPPTPPVVPVGPAPADPEEVGHVEAAFREANDRLAAGRPAAEPTIAVTCECGHDGCHELIEVPHDVYDRVRADARCFVITPGHEVPRAEHVVERHAAFCVVRKHGSAGRAAAADAASADAAG
ncbi:MAG: Serine phosphatase RsbU, regulator of sigma subunit [uncultured Solirubrobacteraceae bacterium]|uniref:Serine phosphatase RsbU, regulator of sigma subunit n=1 Tax=uncultured Solirubrobacteraceae bacterium TaxID=1162706 RepID=A0A6J4RQE7_9ACTN|nr:MAG: Serine phosphatase RsbU, regulator of sigma subunit [uncultured Solirubrobacteraceae bacterium]